MNSNKIIWAEIETQAACRGLPCGCWADLVLWPEKAPESVGGANVPEGSHQAKRSAPLGAVAWVPTTPSWPPVRKARSSLRVPSDDLLSQVAWDWGVLVLETFGA